MNNISFEARLPFTAVVKSSAHLINVLLVVTVLPLFLFMLFFALVSDFVKATPSNYKNDEPVPKISVSDIGRGMVLSPMMSDELFVYFPPGKDYLTANSTFFDTTTYMSADMVDRSPELLWMIYPDFSHVVPENAATVQVIINVLVDYCGKAADVTISDDSLMDYSTKQILVESARNSIFKPAQKNNQSVRCWVQISLEVEV
jgi:hypothetical protein